MTTFCIIYRICYTGLAIIFCEMCEYFNIQGDGPEKLGAGAELLKDANGDTLVSLHTLLEDL